ncbi:hypothetical protein FCT18_18995 [Lysinibacillus sphaericus]|uniref:YhbE protein n=2 Tax=Lysinibacillus sphaericus TaxID=1421 RepID=A0A2S0JUU2_LYSSH|nr:hypothetical protein [Lysinibacillus sphaericus]AVK94905.1 hypothetical protein LS41612_00640 [Lysinibacillus sphaericus]MED4544184.1 hypothetical protein [Lysinibacillus sphaericus]TKI17118.1 hypothetical protein FCT18_18995 [Lysinibacillus sphaericus]SUV19941.1 YhbE protein [Lysinibacillus sphaericus]GEC83579.1 hypothetical protein LSP03_33220 [Lysinibacillus sphaericus]
MTNERIQKQHCITLTSGKIYDLMPDCEQLNIRGAVGVHQKVNLKIISTHGHSVFHSRVIARTLKNTGSCNMKDYCEIGELTNAGNVTIRSGEVSTITSTGKLTIAQSLHAQQFQAIGFVKAQEIQASHFHLKLSGPSSITQLVADDIIIEKDKFSLSLLSKKLHCHSIKGKNLHLAYTIAEFVDGTVIEVGDHCTIQKLYYTESYTISPLAKVHHIIRREQG